MAETKKEFIDAVVALSRVTKVTKGGKRFSFSAEVVSGNQNGMVGIGQGKSHDASSAIAKATAIARKNLIEVSVRENTIPYNVDGKHGAAKVLLLSACKGTGIIAGGAVRAVMMACGFKDVLAKCVSRSRSGRNVAKATLNALAKLRTADQLASMRGKSVKQLVKE